MHSFPQLDMDVHAQFHSTGYGCTCTVSLNWIWMYICKCNDKQYKFTKQNNYYNINLSNGIISTLLYTRTICQLQVRTSQVNMTSLINYLRSNRSKTVVIDSFSYKYCLNMNSPTINYWRCSDRKCLARLQTNIIHNTQ